MIARVPAAEKRHPSSARLDQLFGEEVRAPALVWLALQEAADAYRGQYGHVPEDLRDLIAHQADAVLCCITGHAYRHGWREVGW